MSSSSPSFSIGSCEVGYKVVTTLNLLVRVGIIGEHLKSLESGCPHMLMTCS